MLDAALSLASRGFPIFPLGCRAKEPMIPRHRGGRGALDATTDRGAIVSWWTRWPSANIGLRPDGLAVVDIDPAHGGAETMTALVREHGRLPPTLCSRTGSGGWHYFFRLPSGPVRQGANVLGPGVDTRVDVLGYVVAPPSVHPNGTRYRWAADLEPAPCPAWVATLAAPLPPPSPQLLPGRAECGAIDRARAWLATVDPSVQGQKGSARAYHAALGLVRGFMLSPDVALGLLVRDFNPRCLPPWTERELAQKVACADRASVALGYLLNVPRRVG